MAKAKKEGQILTFKKALVYGIGIFGIQMFIGYINTFQSQFYTSIFKANLMVCAVIILIAKIISSFADPIIGNIIDNSHFKSGKMKPFILISAFPLAILTTLMFVAIDFKGHTGLMYAYITVTTILWNISMSFADIPSQGQLALLTPNSDERSMAAGISNTLRSVALVVPNVVVPVVCMLTKSPEGRITAKEYLITALVLIVFGAAFIAIMLKGTKEVVKAAPNHMSIKDMLLELKNNKMLLLVFASIILGFGRNMAVNIGVQAAAVVFEPINLFGMELSGENLPIMLGIGSGATSMLSIMLAPVISQKLGNKKTFIYFGIYGLIISTVVYILFCIGATNPQLSVLKSFWAIFAYQFMVGLMFGTHGFTPMVMIADTVDYQEMKTGNRTEGVQYAVLSLGTKLSNALSVAVSIFIVGASGYTGEVTAATATPAMQNTIMAAYWLIPGICCMTACIPIFFYKIDDKVKAEIKAYQASKELND